MRSEEGEEGRLVVVKAEGFHGNLEFVEVDETVLIQIE